MLLSDTTFDINNQEVPRVSGVSRGGARYHSGRQQDGEIDVASGVCFARRES